MLNRKIFEAIFIISLIANYSIQAKLLTNSINTDKTVYTVANCKNIQKESNPALAESHKHLDDKVSPERLTEYLKEKNYNNGSGITLEYINEYVKNLVQNNDPRIIVDHSKDEKPKDFLGTIPSGNNVDLDQAIVEYEKNVEETSPSSEKSEYNVHSNNESNESNNNYNENKEVIDNSKSDISNNDKKTSTDNSSLVPKTEELINIDNSSHEERNTNDLQEIYTNIDIIKATEPIKNEELYSFKDIDVKSFEPLQEKFYDENYDLIDKEFKPIKVIRDRPIPELKSYDPEAEDFNLDREEKGWKYQGPLGTKFISEGIVRCGHNGMYLYALVPSGFNYDSSKFVVTLSEEKLSLWKSKPAFCYSNTISIPLTEVAQENSLIQESSRDRVCFYGRVVSISEKSKDGVVTSSTKIQTLFYQLDKTLSMKCDNTAWLELMTNRFKYDDSFFLDGIHKEEASKSISSSNNGMNSCYCGVVGNQ